MLVVQIFALRVELLNNAAESRCPCESRRAVLSRDASSGLGFAWSLFGNLSMYCLGEEPDLELYVTMQLMRSWMQC